MGGKRRRWLGPTIVLAIVFAASMLGLWAIILSTWSEVLPASEHEAAGAFNEALEQFGEGPAYLLISETGSVRVRRDLENASPAPLRALYVVAWEAESSKLLTVRFPFWFVRAKMTESLNLGTLTTALAGDWENLNLRVSETDLERRGAGLVIDRSFPDGSRIAVWTE